MLAVVAGVVAVGVLLGAVGLLIPFDRQTCNPTSISKVLIYGSYAILAGSWIASLIGVFAATGVRARFALLVIAIPIVMIVFVVWGISDVPSTDHCNFQL